MRKFLIRILGTALAFYATNYLIAGFKIDGSWQAYLLASLVFVLFNWVVGPLIKLLLLPINLLTLGLFRWLTNVLLLYIFDLLYGGISITGYHFQGLQSAIISLPSMDISLFWTLVFASLVISITTSLFDSLLAAE